MERASPRQRTDLPPDEKAGCANRPPVRKVRGEQDGAHNRVCVRAWASRSAHDARPRRGDLLEQMMDAV